MKFYLYMFIIMAAVIAVAAICTTVVNEGQTAILMSFGKPVKVINKPGLHLKLPYPIHRSLKIDKRLSMLEPRPAEYLTADKKNLILESVVCFKITAPVTYLKTVRDKEGLEVRLSDLLSSHTGLLLGVKELSDLVNTDTAKVHFQEMSLELTGLLKEDARQLGVEVSSVFIKRIMLPQQNKLAVYDRMRAERDRIAKKYLAEGEEKALEIRAAADKTASIALAEAERDAAIIRGEAEAEAMKIYGEAYQKNPDFYRFQRALQAYEKMFNEKSVIVLDEDSEILKELFSGGKIDG